MSSISSLELRLVMKKYLAIFKMEFLGFFEYRSDFISTLVTTLVRLFVSLFLAYAIFENKTEVYGYTRDSFITYTLVVMILQKMVPSDIQWIITEDILRGKLALALIKPIRYNLYRLASELARKTIELVYNLITVIIVTFIYSRLFEIVIIPERIPAFLLFMFLGYLLHRSYDYIIGLIAFWVKDTSGIDNFSYQIIGLLSGSWLPIDFFGPLASIVKLIPFSYLIYFPIQVLTNDSVSSLQIVKLLVLMIFWIILFMIIGQILWKKGLKKFESVGL